MTSAKLWSMEAIARDLRTACRTVLRSRSVAGLTVALIAIGIGLNSAVFTVLDRMVLRKIAVTEPDRLVHFNGFSGGFRQPVPYTILQRLRERGDLFAGVSGWLDQVVPVEVDGETTPALMVRVDGDFYRVTGAHPQIGRLLNREDRGPVAVISDQFWKGRLGGDPHVLGRTMRIDKTVLTIVGVMPQEFSGMIANVSSDVAVPLGLFQVSNLEPVARLQPEVTLERAVAQIQALWPQLLADTVPPKRSPSEWIADVGPTVKVESASRGQFLWRAEYQGPLELLFGMAVLVLLIVCANLAGLLLARGVSRRKEMAIRMALGASRTHLVWQLLLESLVLACAGGAVSVIVARWGSALGASFLPIGNVAFDYGMNPRALGFAAGLSFFTALAFGLLPAILTTRTGMMQSMKGATGSGGGHGIRRNLLVVQVALSVVLVAGSLLFAMTLAGINAEPLGFRADGVLVLAVQGKSSDWEVGREYFDELSRRLGALPGVQRVSIANELPMEHADYGERGEVSASAGNWVEAESHCAFPTYFATLGTPVLQGREFSSQEGSAIVISQALSSRLFGSESSIGRTVREKREGKTRDREVVGVVSDMKYGSPRAQTAPAFYLPCLEEWTPRQAGTRMMSIAVRGLDDGLERAARREVDALGRQVVFRATSLRDLVSVRMLRERMFAVVTSAYGIVTLAVVAVGLYGLMIFLVASRTREIGIRIAVGAQRSDVLWLLVREVLVILGVGVGFGIGGAIAGTRLATSYLLGTKALEPSMLALTALVLALIGVLAVCVPARRALAVQPTDALRHD
ncbi:MAG TPA: ADOP family duplicated permease [Bryobacteraceae bacterium]|nr:ADOP family duplicated permease [Bryobacteraceae bacterium]